MLPTESFAVDSSLHADDVMRRLAADATDWREPRLSQAARDAGLYGFRLRMKGSSFRIRPTLLTRQIYAPVYEGVVTPHESGSRISGQFRLGRVERIVGAAWAAWAAVAALLVMGVRGVFVAAAIALVASLWVRYCLTTVWPSGETARAETKELLLRAAGVSPPTSTISRLTGRSSGPA
jgi:hypothetical protein